MQLEYSAEILYVDSTIHGELGDVSWPCRTLASSWVSSSLQRWFHTAKPTWNKPPGPVGEKGMGTYGEMLPFGIHVLFLSPSHCTIIFICGLHWWLEFNFPEWKDAFWSMWCMHIISFNVLSDSSCLNFNFMIYMPFHGTATIFLGTPLGDAYALEVIFEAQDCTRVVNFAFKHHFYSWVRFCTC